jgi:hypothetical protein
MQSTSTPDKHYNKGEGLACFVWSLVIVFGPLGFVWLLFLGFWLLFAYSGNINEYCNITPGGDGPVRVLAVANLQVG